MYNAYLELFTQVQGTGRQRKKAGTIRTPIVALCMLRPAGAFALALRVVLPSSIREL